MLEMINKNLHDAWEDFCAHLQDYPTAPSELRQLWGKFVRVMGYLSEERSRILRDLSRIKLGKEAGSFLSEARALSLKGLSYDERKAYLMLSAPQEEREFTVALEEVESMIDSLFRIERILKGYFQVMSLDMKLSFEGHES